MLAAYCERQLSAAFTVDGACIALRSARGVRAVFETWLEKCLLPTLKPGQVVILANATFHHGRADLLKEGKERRDIMGETP